MILFDEAENSRRHINLTPLIDVVFILLVFFMLVANFLRWVSFDLTMADTNAVVERHDAISIIQVEGGDRYTLNGAGMQLPQLIDSLQVSRGSAPQLTLIQPGDAALLQDIVKLMDALHHAGIEPVALRQQEGTDDF